MNFFLNMFRTNFFLAFSDCSKQNPEAPSLLAGIQDFLPRITTGFLPNYFSMVYLEIPPGTISHESII